MQAELKANLSRAIRTVWGTALYRWALGVGFLLSAFSAWPSAVAPIAFGYLTLNTALSCVMEYHQAWAAANSAVSDMAERKTRHAIVLAASRGQAGIAVDTEDFWADVNNRVDGELADQNSFANKPVGFWAGLGLVSGSLVWRAVADIVGIGVAVALAQ